MHAEYVNFLADEAHKVGLAIGLKNSLDIIPDVVANVQFAVNEQCNQYKECARYKPFTNLGKAVFNIEYPSEGGKCSTTADVVMSSVEKPMALDTLGGFCASNGKTGIQL